jgi:hypothetical protein
MFNHGLRKLIAEWYQGIISVTYNYTAESFSDKGHYFTRINRESFFLIDSVGLGRLTREKFRCGKTGAKVPSSGSTNYSNLGRVYRWSERLSMDTQGAIKSMRTDRCSNQFARSGSQEDVAQRSQRRCTCSNILPSSVTSAVCKRNGRHLLIH